MIDAETTLRDVLLLIVFILMVDGLSDRSPEYDSANTLLEISATAQDQASSNEPRGSSEKVLAVQVSNAQSYNVNGRRVDMPQLHETTVRHRISKLNVSAPATLAAGEFITAIKNLSTLNLPIDIKDSPQ